VNIQYSKKKEELRHDPVMESIIRAKQFVEQRASYFTGGLIAVLFVVAFVFIYQSMRKSSVEKAQEAFGRAMSAFSSRDEEKAIELLTVVSDNHKHTPQAVYSAYILGTIFINRGQHDQAIEWLKLAVSKRTDVGFAGAAALEALATAYEAKEDYDNAIAYGEKALNDRRLSYRRPEIRWKLALMQKNLNRFDEARRFCDQVLADTLAVDLHQRVRNLRVEMDLAGKS